MFDFLRTPAPSHPSLLSFAALLLFLMFVFPPKAQAGSKPGPRSGSPDSARSGVHPPVAEDGEGVEVYSVDLARAILGTSRGAKIRASLDAHRAELQAAIDRSRAMLEDDAPKLTRRAYDERIDRIDREIDSAEDVLAQEEAAALAPIAERIDLLLHQASAASPRRLIVESGAGQLIGQASACDQTPWLTRALELRDTLDAPSRTPTQPSRTPAQPSQPPTRSSGTPAQPPSTRTCRFSCLATINLDAILPRFGPAQRAKQTLDALRDAKQDELDKAGRTLADLTSRRNLERSEREGLERKRRDLAHLAQRYQEEVLAAETAHKTQVLGALDRRIGLWAKRHNAAILRYSASKDGELPEAVSHQGHDATVWLTNQNIDEAQQPQPGAPSWLSTSPCAVVPVAN